jgi:hypothetical protein
VVHTKARDLIWKTNYKSKRARHQELNSIIVDAWEKAKGLGVMAQVVEYKCEALSSICNTAQKNNDKFVILTKFTSQLPFKMCTLEQEVWLKT